jgi:hypothetical protein
MHEIHPSLLDQTRQPPRIGEDGDGVLAGYRQRDDLAAGLSDGGCHPPPFGGNERARAGSAQRFGDLDSRLLTASSIKPWHYLEYAYLSHDSGPIYWRA